MKGISLEAQAASLLELSRKRGLLKSALAQFLREKEGQEAREEKEVVDFASFFLPEGTLAVFLIYSAREALYYLPLLLSLAGGKLFFKEAAGTKAYARALLRLLAKSAILKGERGKFCFRLLREPPLKISPFPATHSQKLARVSQQSVLKSFHFLPKGVVPEVLLTSQQTTPRFLPLTWGHASYLPQEGGEYTLAFFQEYLPHRRTAWEAALTWFKKLYFAPHPPLEAALLKQAWEVGKVTAALHNYLFTLPHPSFEPTEITPADLERWGEEMESRLAETKKALLAFPFADKSVQELASHFLSSSRELSAAFGELKKISLPGKKCRGHLDLHLGQILRTKRGLVVIDFEGEPAAREEEEKFSPLKDLAGIVRSFFYAAASALGSPNSTPGLSSLLAAGEKAAAKAARTFLCAYRFYFRLPGILPPKEEDSFVFLRALVFEKAVYEISYELKYRPSWLFVPLATFQAFPFSKSSARKSRRRS